MAQYTKSENVSCVGVVKPFANAPRDEKNKVIFPTMDDAKVHGVCIEEGGNVLEVYYVIYDAPVTWQQHRDRIGSIGSSYLQRFPVKNKHSDELDKLMARSVIKHLRTLQQEGRIGVLNPNKNVFARQNGNVQTGACKKKTEKVVYDHMGEDISDFDA